MSNSGRRDFIRKSMALGLGALGAEPPLPSGEPVTEPRVTSQAQPEFFEGFKREQIKTSGATINTVYGGKGSPVLLLHGIPETHVLWRKVAPLLAQDYFLLITHLPHHGDNNTPPPVPHHSSHPHPPL